MKNLYEKKEGILYDLYCLEADKMWSFVGNKGNKQWIWLVMNTANRQIIGFHIGGSGNQTLKFFLTRYLLFSKQMPYFSLIFGMVTTY